jgi:DNA-binding NarL/FixJ family response regulator
MDADMKTTAALAAAARLAGQSGSAIGALRAVGLEMPDADQIRRLAAPWHTILGPEDFDGPVIEAICFGYLAGSAAPARHPRPLHNVTTFLMDEDLVVLAAEGESILRLPWFEEEMFVGRQLPDVIEIPRKIRTLAVDSYSEALGGANSDYAFTSYGHKFSVDAIPIRDDTGRARFVMAIATPGRSAASAASAAARHANRLTRAAQEAELQAAELLAKRGGSSSAAAASQRALVARQAAGRARRHAERLAAQSAPLQLTDRELEVLTLASVGCSYAEIAEQLVVTTATVKTHLHHCYDKLAVRDKAAAVATALRHGLID